MNNEPVAWMETYKGEPNNLDWDKSNLNYGSEFHDVIPLYTQDQLEEARKLGMQQERALWNLSASTQEIMDTHPVKELTDEEIMEVANEIFSKYKNWHHYQLDFARAILRKAQEK